MSTPGASPPPEPPGNVFVSNDALRRIREETGLGRSFRDGELAHWLREVAREDPCERDAEDALGEHQQAC